MLARLGERISGFFRATAPDPFVLAILLTALTFLLAAIWGDYPGASGADRLRLVVEGWQGGFWNLLAFGMQMCLILVTGHALASSPPIARLLGAIAGGARTPRQAVVLVSVCAIGFGLINWGLGLIVGAILARDAASRLAERGVNPPRNLLAAAGYTGMLTWHGGLSGSAPLAAAQPEQLASLLGPALAEQIGALPVSATLLTPLNFVATGGLLLLVPLTLSLLVPPGAGGAVEPTAPAAREAPADASADRATTLPERLERSPVVAALISVPAIFWLFWRFSAGGVDALTLNTANLAFLATGLLLHGSPVRYAQAIEDGARGCAGIILQFPLYAGIMGVMTDSALAAGVSRWFASVAGDSEGALASMTFLSAGLVNLFVPSGGGQWAVQGPIAMQAALDAGARPERLVMAVAYGDQLTNMLQPFWALPLLAITGAKAREVVGYTAIVMVVAALWLVGCLVLV
jgi:short-chain fatty acids transporter